MGLHIKNKCLINGEKFEYEIRWSNDEDLIKIREWLEEESLLEIDGNFLCNWNIILSAHENENLLVLVDCQKSLPLGFQCGQLINPGILQIKNEYRRKGFGKLMVRHCLELAQESNESVLFIECNPASSIPFWENMGFTIISKDSYGSSTKAYQVVQRELKHGVVGSIVDVRISFYPEKKKWESSVEPLSVSFQKATYDNDGRIYLCERVSYASGITEYIGDVVIEIEVSGKVIYLDKARYEESSLLGVQRCSNGFYLDVILKTI